MDLELSQSLNAKIASYKYKEANTSIKTQAKYFNSHLGPEVGNAFNPSRYALVDVGKQIFPVFMKFKPV